MKLLYFAWLRTKTGVAHEEVAPPEHVRDVASLIEWLPTRGPNFADAFKNTAVVRVAVNQQYARPDHPLKAGDEVALFPPVTGG
ncbi:molybdenum cofactor biosynthesis protein MoaD [Skermanella stibiiresistens SB22]|uniref:Molybdopterin synthase sulfur carrier subunit n=1 Tax=Skermanella stibiiresistens SB22 TaxID=1385369 RepID=W9HBA4_9PROT|nr:molybdopterin converting factor subunit 1 [Skermanella stibiiresistens]EWY41123.1 molybdenum cofactor biosynthesis protein MoaD [Skermanella stibiiresistens SB22]